MDSWYETAKNIFALIGAGSVLFTIGLMLFAILSRLGRD
jgi:hypothetical protein